MAVEEHAASGGDLKTGLGDPLCQVARSVEPRLEALLHVSESFAGRPRLRIETTMPVVTPRLVLHMKSGRIINPDDLAGTPGWAKPIVAAALPAVLKP
jgi:hypothetical protein